MNPGKIICAGLNYKEHADEVGFDLPDSPLIFLKSTSALIKTGESIILPSESSQIEHEAELAVIIGKTAKNVSLDETSHVILGYAAANDVTARDIQYKESQWSRSKSFDTFCPIGDISAAKLSPNARIQCFVNGILKQDSSIDQMIFGINEIISFASKTMTLHPGDIILTGSPKGTSSLLSGDIVEVRIEGVGSVCNPVI